MTTRGLESFLAAWDNDDIDALGDAYEALRAECEALRKDAERYRWLRDAAMTEKAILDRIARECTPTEPHGDAVEAACKAIAEFNESPNTDWISRPIVAAGIASAYPELVARAEKAEAERDALRKRIAEATVTNVWWDGHFERIDCAVPYDYKGRRVALVKLEDGE